MKHYDVFGVGNALVDILALTEESLLKKLGWSKGVMTLVDAETQGKVLTELEGIKKELRSGGSAANTMISIANSGGTGCYTGKVSEDAYGEFYKQDMEKAGIVFEVKPSNEGHTGTCVILTTPDAERTMLTHLGISSTLTKNDLDLDRLKVSGYSYLEGYLWDGPSTKEACLVTMEESKKAGVKVSMTYSDPFCVNRSREDFIRLTKDYCDLVFCNAEEAKALAETESKEEALKFIAGLCDTVMMTDSANGAFVSEKGNIRHVSGFPVNKLLDTTGAGDSFAAGVLYGLTHGYSSENSAKWGNYVASRIVQEIGPRLSVRLMGRQEEILGKL
ncbi:adenosine kinase [Leptospira wolffii]|uniref:Adenosine kinase n=1 Tax=Leptospira wolffii TaxID=409998 RepID=A0ABV5BR73_9LEPT|nr:adenosine kinase [Leptospira wolffii]TGK56093.1 adenosine kinase [Leptospira wolffii]TGK72139.1 adenosine kinase [Leptospira wolffii]TGK77443.1 adenosine kinase [Leptospira wolffii]TGL27716.1 adenosine kinase [Leptospira wolffii]TGL54749.1 adenosine kinase [Leptospira wolffii]